MRPREGEQGREEQRLHHDFRVRVAAEPELDQVDGEQERGRERRRLADQPRASEVHGEQAERGPADDRPECAAQSGGVESDRDRRRVQMRELSDDATAVRIQQEEPHESRAVVLLARVRRKEQAAHGCRDRRRDAIRNHQRAGLRDLDAFADVAAGISSADDVLRRRRKPPDADRENRQRQQRRPRDPSCRAVVGRGGSARHRS